MINVMIAIPIAGDHVSTELFKSFSTMLLTTIKEMPSDFSLNLMTTSLKPLDEARNSLVRRALKAGATHVFFVDNDMALPKMTLINLLKHDVPMVSGLYFKRATPPTPVAYDKMNGPNFHIFLDYPDRQLVDVVGVGMGCCLIKKEVFDTVKDPWFRFKFDQPVVEGHKNENFKGVLAEDLSFCKKVTEAGIGIKLDTSVKCGHVGKAVITEEAFKGWTVKKP